MQRNDIAPPDIPLVFEAALLLIVDFVSQNGSGDFIPHEHHTFLAIQPQHFAGVHKRPARLPMTCIDAVLQDIRPIV